MIVSDSFHVRAAVRTVLDAEDQVVEADDGRDVRILAAEHEPDICVVDLQVGSMGAMAICLDLRLEESGGRLPHVPVLMLLDRRADVFMARRSGADGWVVKPADPIRLRRAVDAVLAGSRFEDSSYTPTPLAVPAWIGAPLSMPPVRSAGVAAEGHAQRTGRTVPRRTVGPS